jgi:hypothetical protein
MAIVVILIIFLVLPVGIVLLSDRISDWRRWRTESPEKMAVERQAYIQRLLHPDWEFYEQHLQRPAPMALKELYSDQVLITLQDINYSEDYNISTFGALDKEGLLDTQPWLGFDVVAIATSDCGDPIYLKPGASEVDKVYITHHDGGDTEEFAESVEAMLRKLKEN